MLESSASFDDLDFVQMRISNGGTSPTKRARYSIVGGAGLKELLALRGFAGYEIDNRLSIWFLEFLKMKHTPAGEAFTELVLTGLVLGALLERAGDALAIPEGQTAARWRVLARASKTDMTVAEIARSLNQSRQSVQKIADALADDDLAIYIDNPGDRRAKLRPLTHLGREHPEIHTFQAVFMGK